MTARAPKARAAKTQSPAVQPAAERKVLHTPYSIQHAHTVNGGYVLKVLEKGMDRRIRAKVSHRPDGVFYLPTMLTGTVMSFLFEESTSRLILQDY